MIGLERRILLNNKKKVVSKLIKHILKPFVTERNFSFHKPLIMVRERTDVLHIINFDLGLAGFTCDIAVQPLYIPEETLVLSFGNRISRFGVTMPERWEYGQTEVEIEQGLQEIKMLLEKHALFWFDDVGTPDGIVSFIESGRVNNTNLIVGFPPYLKNLYLGFSYLYNEQFNKGCEALQNTLQILRQDSRPWVEEVKRLSKNMFSLAKNEPEKIKTTLNEFTSYTKENLKLKIK